MRFVLECSDTISAAAARKGSKFGETVPLTTIGIAAVLDSAGMPCIPGAIRLTYNAPALVTDPAIEKLRLANPRTFRALPFWAVDALYTPFSQCGFLSRHWLPFEVALDLSTQEELFRAPLGVAEKRRPPQLWLEWFTIKNHGHYYGKGTGVPLQLTLEDRGEINLPASSVSERLVLRPVLRTPDGNGWRVSFRMTGPKSFCRNWEIKRLPDPFGNESWISPDFEVLLPQHGNYTIEIVGELAWPESTYKVFYTLILADGKSKMP